MVLCALSPVGIPRLGRMLDSYDRDVLWLRVINVFGLQGQPDQVTFEPVDAAGRVLRDRSGLKRRHTVQVSAALPRLVPSQLVSLARDGGTVQVRVLPADATPDACPTPQR
jgi:hypothetical protein